MIEPVIGLYAVYEPPEEGWQNWEQQILQIEALLNEAGARVITAPEAVYDDASCARVMDWFRQQPIDVFHVLVVCWSFDHYTLRIQQAVQKPVIVRSIPGIRTGSIVGGQQLNCVLTDLEVEHSYFYGELDNDEAIHQTVVYATACAMRSRLQGARIGVIGRRTEGMTPTAVDEVEILRLFGVQLVHFGFDEFLEMAAGVTDQAAEQVWRGIHARAAQVTSKPRDGLASTKNYLAARKLVEERGFQALTIGSYPRCQGTMCLPIALLNDEGIPTGCEGDINSTLSMLLLSYLSDAPIHFGEMLALNRADNTIVTSHCGAGAPSLADSEGFTLCPVRLANSGVCIRYPARPGPVTYVNLVGRKGNYRLCAFEGQAVPTGMVFEGNPLKFHLETPINTIIQRTADYGFGHHWMTAYGHFNEVLLTFCKLTGITGLFPDLE